MYDMREGMEGSRGGGGGGLRFKFHRPEMCSGMQESGRPGAVESSEEDLLRGHYEGEVLDAAPIRDAVSFVN